MDSSSRMARFIASVRAAAFTSSSGGRDDAPVSASAELREQNSPARLLAPAVARYPDALGVAAEQVVGADVVRRLEDQADQIVLWLTDCPAWETLRADLLGLAADGHHPVALLRQAANMDELDTARDPGRRAGLSAPALGVREGAWAAAVAARHPVPGCRGPIVGSLPAGPS